MDVKITTCRTPLPGMEVRIVNPETVKPAARGDVGMVILRGHLTPGYFQKPVETALAQLPDGFFNTGASAGSTTPDASISARA